MQQIFVSTKYSDIGCGVLSNQQEKGLEVARYIESHTKLLEAFHKYLVNLEFKDRNSIDASLYTYICIAICKAICIAICIAICTAICTSADGCI